MNAGYSRGSVSAKQVQRKMNSVTKSVLKIEAIRNIVRSGNSEKESFMNWLRGKETCSYALSTNSITLETPISLDYAWVVQYDDNLFAYIDDAEKTFDKFSKEGMFHHLSSQSKPELTSFA